MGDDVRYWGPLLTGGIFLVVWNAVILGLGLTTWWKGAVPGLRRLSLWTTVCSLGFSAGYLALAAWYPAWYVPIADLATRLLALPIMLCFYLALWSTIASFQKTPEARRAAMKAGAISGFAAFGMWVSHAFLEGWPQSLADVVAGLVFVAGIIIGQKAEKDLRGGSQPRNPACPM